MNCNEAREVLSHDFPSPLGPRELEAQQHMRHCERCCSYLRADVELRQRLRELEPEKPSAQFKEKLFTEISRLRWEKSRRERKRKLRRLASIGAAIILTVMAGWFWLARGPEPSSQLTLADFLVEDHQQNLPGRFMTTAAAASEIESWFEGKVDFPLHVQVLEETEILGARLCQVEGRRAALIFYRCGSHMLSWFTFPQSREHGPKESPALLTLRGYHLVMWDENGLTHAVISDMDSEELIRMLSQQRG